ncbi:MAG: SDR family oxidoreductase [Alphaproteobacteria bacterium]
MIEQRTIFITGAASGLGRETARLFAERGWYVGASDIDGPGLAALKAELGPNHVHTAIHDVTDREAWTRTIDSFSTVTGGRMDVFYNNAGIGVGGALEQMPEATAHKIIAVNLTGVVHGVYACLPMLKATATKTGQADLVNMGSAAGIFGAPGVAIYCATKFAVRGLTDSLYGELAQYGIRVSELQPAFLDTAILDTETDAEPGAGKARLEALGQTVLPARLAAQAVWNIAHAKTPKVHYALGRPAQTIQLFARFLPKTMRARLRKAFEARPDALI